MAIIKIECSMRKWANIRFRLFVKIKRFFYKPVKSSYNIPIIINNYNRLNYLQLQIGWLKKAGYNNIYIIDNNSTYKPLLEYYKKLPYTIFRLDRNQGHFSIWETIIFSLFSHDYYVYTDADILPVKECPKDILFYFKSILKKYPQYKKVGFGLKIDDLPDHFSFKEQVCKWEEQFWLKRIDINLYDALIDTTFALYRPGAKGGADGPAIRTGGRFLAMHLPWYENTKNLDQETLYYLQSASASSSWYNTVKGQNNQYLE